MKWLTIASVALLMSGCVATTPIAASKSVVLSKQQVAQIKASVVQDFFDPDAANFRNIRAVDVTLADGQTFRRVCGEVNGKNRYGAYVGFEMFGGTITQGQFQREDFFGPCES